MSEVMVVGITPIPKIFSKAKKQGDGKKVLGFYERGTKKRTEVDVFWQVEKEDLVPVVEKALYDFVCKGYDQEIALLKERIKQLEEKQDGGKDK